MVSSTCVESQSEVALLDPLAPPEDATEIWERLDAKPPTLVVVLKPDHVRDTDLFVSRYGARAFGPYLFWRQNIPERTSKGSSQEVSYPAASSPCTTAAVATRRPSGCPSNTCWCSQTA